MTSSPLRQVLEYFEASAAASSGAIALPQLARALGLERGILEGMIAYWVRKGKLREVSGAACTTCGSAAGCPFIVAMPRHYELVTTAAADQSPASTCACGTGCH